MRVAVVNIRKMRMCMRDGQMNVRMRVWLRPIPIEIVLMLMMLVVTVLVCVCQPLVRMGMFVAFAQM